MPSTAIESDLFGGSFGNDEMRELFSDESLVSVLPASRRRPVPGRGGGRADSGGGGAGDLRKGLSPGKFPGARTSARAWKPTRTVLWRL